MTEKKLLLTREAAKLLRISEERLRLLVRKKKIKAYKEGRRGGCHIPTKEVDNYIENRSK